MQQPSYAGWSAREFMDHLTGLMPLWESEDGRMLFDESDVDSGIPTGRIVVFRMKWDGSCGERVVITKRDRCQSPVSAGIPELIECGNGRLKLMDRMTQPQREQLKVATNPFAPRPKSVVS